jgi:ABC-type bacteriocin/lantibiotic exporter with double-glycine peptidase domain
MIGNWWSKEPTHISKSISSLFFFLYSFFFFRILSKLMFLYIVILCIFNSMLLYTYYIISSRMLIHIVNYWTKGLSKSVNTSTMTKKKKYKRTNNDLLNTTQKTKDNYTTPVEFYEPWILLETWMCNKSNGIGVWKTTA